MKRIILVLLLTSCISSQKELTKDFFVAVERGKIEEVKTLIDKGVDVNSREIRPHHSKDRTALYYKIRSQNYDMFRFLIREGADLNFVDLKGRSYLHVAALPDEYPEFDYNDNPDPRIMKYLLEKGNLDINKLDRYKNTPLHYSVCPPKFELVKELVRHNADVNIENEAKQTPLHEVVDIYRTRVYEQQMGNNAIRIVQLLMKHGARNPRKALSILLEIKRNYNKAYNKAMFTKQLRGIAQMEKVLRKYIKR